MTSVSSKSINKTKHFGPKISILPWIIVEKTDAGDKFGGIKMWVTHTQPGGWLCKSASGYGESRTRNADWSSKVFLPFRSHWSNETFPFNILASFKDSSPSESTSDVARLSKWARSINRVNDIPGKWRRPGQLGKILDDGSPNWLESHQKQQQHQPRKKQANDEQRPFFIIFTAVVNRFIVSRLTLNI